MTLGEPELVVERASDITAKVVEHANRADLLVLGLRRPQGGRRVFGDAVPRIASQARCATIVISRGS
jgi:nucleotide-binding universal stress UspA family protein